MSNKILTPVEQSFMEESGITKWTTRVPYVIVENYPKLGLLTSLRFLEWVAENPEGVISLPTGKTSEHFIKWTQHFLTNWDDKKLIALREKYSLTLKKKPDLRGLHFVQMDEFYPISPAQHNSFNNYVSNYYIDLFGLDRKKALLINSDAIPLAEGKTYSQVFPSLEVDLSLRYRECKTPVERLQQRSIFMIDDWCTEYEQKIREKGGIGFFLGGIGPDGHISFNTRGSDHHSTTRLTATNFETQAVAASDLGGIEVSRKRLVITIGLETITWNPDSVVIISAAGEAKAGIVKDSLEHEPTNLYPATVLQKLQKSRFYLTAGAASKLNDSVMRYYKLNGWSQRKSEKAIIDLCKKIEKYGHRLVAEDLTSDPICQLMPGDPLDNVESVMKSINQKIQKGMVEETNQVYLHMAPHHDDIMLGILPHIAHQLRSATNEFHFAICTSGFNAVTNSFLKEALLNVLNFIDKGEIQMINYPDFFKTGYLYKRDKDISHYLNKVASKDIPGQQRGLSHRIVRDLVEIYKLKSIEQLKSQIKEIIDTLDKSYDGEKNPQPIQRIKGMIREFEEELVWAHYGVQVKNIHHLRLGFYTGDIFTPPPDRDRDVRPIYNLIKEVKPTVISLAFDPEGSGPDTHYKSMQTIAEAVRIWSKEADTSKLRIWGYRNVWYRFHAADADVIAPVSLLSMASLNSTFENCYLSQVNASFPSYELDGHFSALSQRIWVEQLKDIQLLLGKDFFYLNSHPRIRGAHGLLFFKEMTVDEFLSSASSMEKSMEGPSH